MTNTTEKSRQAAKEEAVRLALEHGMALIRRNFEIHGMNASGETKLISRSASYDTVWSDALKVLKEQNEKQVTSAHQVFDQLLKESKHCVLATASKDGVPELAQMQFAEAGNRSIYFKTYSYHRKYPNLIHNPRVSVNFHHNSKYTQTDGIVHELSGSEETLAKKKLLTKYGDSGFFHDSEVRYFSYTPTWVRVRLTGEYPPKFETILGNEKK